MISFFIPGHPQGKGRPRMGRVAGHAKLYAPGKTLAYEGLVSYIAKQAMNGSSPFDEAMNVELVIKHAIPASWSKKKKEEAKSDILRPTTKPDIDNVVKALFDGMNGVVWRDDVLVAQLFAVRMYSDEPGISVIVRPMK